MGFDTKTFARGGGRDFTIFENCQGVARGDGNALELTDILIALKPHAEVINHELSLVHKMSLQTLTLIIIQACKGSW